MKTIEIVVNGETRSVRDGETVLGLLQSLGLDPGRVAVELDMVIVKQSDWPNRVLQPGSRVEIVHFVGGG